MDRPATANKEDNKGHNKEHKSPKETDAYKAVA
jgi:hypothetical protein